MSSIGQNERSGWRAALACMLSLAVAMGLGRFAFTPLLPVMLHEGQLDLQGGGLLASLNYLGYFLGALLAAALRQPAPRVVRGALLATGLLLLGMGLVGGFGAWAVLRTLAGVASALAFVYTSGWGLRRLAETGMSALGGVIYTGPGVGIAITGLMGGVMERWGADTSWIGFGAVGLAVTALVWRVFGDGGAAAQAGTAARVTATAPPGRRRGEAGWLIGLYGLAGFGYIITATFLPVIARQALPGSAWADLFWPLFGVAVVAGALLGARAPLQWDNRLLLSACYTLQGLGVVLSVVWPTIGGFVLGSLLLGLPFTALTLYAMREARRLRGNAAAGLIGTATASYGLGQIAGPLFAAPLAQRSGSFTQPLLAAALALAAGAVLFVMVWWRHRR